MATVGRQHQSDKIGLTERGGFLVHRSHSTSEDETEIRNTKGACAHGGAAEEIIHGAQSMKSAENRSLVDHMNVHRHT